MVLKTSTKAALGATAIFSTIAAFGYMYYTGKLDCFFGSRIEEKSNDKKKRKKKPTPSSSVSMEEIPELSPRTAVDKPSDCPPVNNSDSNVLVSKSKKSESKALPSRKPSRLIDLPVEEIMKLPPEQREQVFYAILIEGENLLNKGKNQIFGNLLL